jgi:hypothetical protein
LLGLGENPMMLSTQRSINFIRRTQMCIERLTRHAGFVLAALATAGVLGVAVDRLPALSALVL